jgi:hypothetical protein
MKTGRPPLDTSRITTEGEIKLTIFSGKLFIYLGMRRGFNDGVCQNYCRLGLTPYALVNVLRNFEETSFSHRICRQQFPPKRQYNLSNYTASHSQLP